jgi:hypothetical protein
MTVEEKDQAWLMDGYSGREVSTWEWTAPVLQPTLGHPSKMAERGNFSIGRALGSAPGHSLSLEGEIPRCVTTYLSMCWTNGVTGWSETWRIVREMTRRKLCKRDMLDHSECEKKWRSFQPVWCLPKGDLQRRNLTWWQLILFHRCSSAFFSIHLCHRSMDPWWKWSWCWGWRLFKGSTTWIFTHQCWPAYSHHWVPNLPAAETYWYDTVPWGDQPAPWWEVGYIGPILSWRGSILFLL